MQTSSCPRAPSPRLPLAHLCSVVVSASVLVLLVSSLGILSACGEQPGTIYIWSDLFGSGDPPLIEPEPVPDVIEPEPTPEPGTGDFSVERWGVISGASPVCFSAAQTVDAAHLVFQDGPNDVRLALELQPNSNLAWSTTVNTSPLPIACTSTPYRGFSTLIGFAGDESAATEFIGFDRAGEPSYFSDFGFFPDQVLLPQFLSSNQSELLVAGRLFPSAPGDPFIILQVTDAGEVGALGIIETPNNEITGMVTTQNRHFVLVAQNEEAGSTLFSFDRALTAVLVTQFFPTTSGLPPLRFAGRNRLAVNPNNTVAIALDHSVELYTEQVIPVQRWQLPEDEDIVVITHGASQFYVATNADRVARVRALDPQAGTTRVASVVNEVPARAYSLAPGAVTGVLFAWEESGASPARTTVDEIRPR